MTESTPIYVEVGMHLYMSDDFTLPEVGLREDTN